MGEGHSDRPRLGQSTEKECLPTVKCRGCQSVGKQDLSWHRQCHKVDSVCVDISSRLFKREQTVNMVTDYTVQKTIAQIAMVWTWQTQFIRLCWWNQCYLMCLFVWKMFAWYCSTLWLPGDGAGVWFKWSESKKYTHINLMLQKISYNNLAMQFSHPN